LRAEAEGFIPESKNIDLEELEEYSELKADLYLVPVEKGQVIRLNNIFFEFDKATLLPESFLELDQLFEILDKNPEIKIEISGHTDDKGSEEYNQKLSEERANAVMRYIFAKGINLRRLSVKSYGETKPITSNETEEGRQLNRRVEFRIL